MKHGGVMAWLHAFLILPANVDHVVESHPLHHTPGKKKIFDYPLKRKLGGLLEGIRTG
jgi:hypothetical protein